MKVLVFTENDHNIPRRYWQYSVPLIKQKGIDVQYATLRGREILHDLFEKEHGIVSRTFDSPSARDYFRVSRDLRRLAIKEKFDIIHAAEAIPATIAGMARLAMPRTKCIYHYHHIIPVGRKQKLLSRIASNLVDVVMPVSESTREASIKYDHVRPERSITALNGTVPLRSVSEEETAAVRRRLEIPVDARVISIVARLRREKGHRTLFEAAEILARSEPRPIHIIVTGEGYDEPSLKEYASTFRNFTVHFMGNQEDVAPWFAVGDVIAVPSHLEAFGLVAIEAMSSGKPLVASDLEGLAEIVENEISGLLVPPRDPDVLAGAIERIFNSPELVKKLSENGPKRVDEKFSIDAMVSSWIRCYEKTILM